ncbi:TTN [Mytilus coruscus]|uniref:TTN n=1 Tax=Mytilus coruscus TaxID=42192 RepID=A0A6J8BNC9_MYTCO|nr:TTN [Mytilus coruscus]
MIGVIGRSGDVNVYVSSEPKYTTIRWYKNKALLKESAKYSMTENMMIVNDDFHGREVQLDGYRLTLVINELRFEDAAVYKLQLSNGIGNFVDHNLFLNIGNIPQTPRNITVISDRKTSLTIQWIPVDKANAIQSASIPMVALGTSPTIITIVAWLVVGLVRFKQKTIIKTKRSTKRYQ